MESNYKAYSRRTSAISGMLGILFSCGLAVVLFASGFAVCTLRPTTAMLSRLFSNFETSVYLPDDTVTLAIATRNFTVEPQGGNPTQAATTLAEQVLVAAQHSSASNSLKKSAWENISFPETGVGNTSPSISSSGNGFSNSQNNLGTSNAVASMYALAAQGAQYALGPDEISHLVDCNILITRATRVLIVVFVFSVVLGIMLGVSFSRQAFARSLIAAPLVLLCALAAVGVWATIDFYGFFSAFHGLFFPQGNWTFPANSLLICMLPTPFWIAMLALWILVSAALSALSVVVGRRMLRS